MTNKTSAQLQSINKLDRRGTVLSLVPLAKFSQQILIWIAGGLIFSRLSSMWLVGKALLCADLAVQNIVKSAGVGQCPSKM